MRSKTKSRYRTIDMCMYSDERFKNLSCPPSAAYLWTYFLSGPFTTQIPGIYKAGRMAMSEDIGWSLEDFDRVLLEIKNQGMLQWDLDAKVVYIKNFLRRNQPLNPSVVAGWKDDWEMIPNCTLKINAYDNFLLFFKSKVENAILSKDKQFIKSANMFLEAFFGYVKKPSLHNGVHQGGHNVPHHVTHDVPHDGGHEGPNEEQEQEQEQEREQEQDQEVFPGDKKSLLVRQVFDHWVGVMQSKRAALDDKLKKLILAKLKYFTVEDICLAIDGCLYDDWLMGRDPKTNGKKFNTLHYILRDKHFSQLIEYAESPPLARVELSKDDQRRLKNQQESQKFLERMKNKNGEKK